MASIALKHATGNSTSLHSPAANPSADITLKVPSTTGSAGQALKVASANHSATNAELEWGGAGKILQVVQNNITEKLSQSTASEAWSSFSELDTNITPTSSSNKVLIQGWLNVGASAGMTVFIKLRRGSTDISIADAAGSRRRATASGNCISVSGSQAIPFCFLDSPSTTSATTYTIQASHPSGSTQTISINSDHADGDDADAARQSSNIILMEVAA